MKHNKILNKKSKVLISSQSQSNMKDNKKMKGNDVQANDKIKLFTCHYRNKFVNNMSSLHKSSSSQLLYSVKKNNNLTNTSQNQKNKNKYINIIPHKTKNETTKKELQTYTYYSHMAKQKKDNKTNNSLFWNLSKDKLEKSSSSPSKLGKTTFINDPKQKKPLIQSRENVRKYYKDKQSNPTEMTQDKRFDFELFKKRLQKAHNQYNPNIPNQEKTYNQRSNHMTCNSIEHFDISLKSSIGPNLQQSTPVLEALMSPYEISNQTLQDLITINDCSPQMSPEKKKNKTNNREKDIKMMYSYLDALK